MIAEHRKIDQAMFFIKICSRIHPEATYELSGYSDIEKKRLYE